MVHCSRSGLGLRNRTTGQQRNLVYFGIGYFYIGYFKFPRGNGFAREMRTPEW